MKLAILNGDERELLEAYRMMVSENKATFLALAAKTLTPLPFPYPGKYTNALRSSGSKNKIISSEHGGLEYPNSKIDFIWDHL